MAETGDAIDYVVASLAIPGLFCNQKVDGKRLCDGGVAMNTPFLHWLDDPAISTIIVHRIKHTPGTELTTEWPTLSSGFATCHQVIADQVDKLQLELAAKQSGKRVIDIVTETAHPTLVPHGQRPELIETGRKSGRRTVELLRGD